MTVTAAGTDTPFGSRRLAVSQLGIGTAAWGENAPLYDQRVSEDDAIAAALRIFESPITVLDTSNNYGDGESERRIGVAIAERGGLPPGFVLQTKLDRDPVTGVFDPPRLWRSLEESLERLRLPSLPLLFLHDPENSTYEELMRPRGPIAALLDMRERGFAQYIGISGGPVSLLTRFVDTGLFDAVITHNRWTLVDGTAGALIDHAAERSLVVENAAVYGGGVLAQWPRGSDRYHYRLASPAVLAAIDAMGHACADHGVPLAAAALQASMGRPGIGVTIVGATSAAEVDETLALAETPIPAELAATLATLRPEPETWIGD